jgi:DNA-binding transcriptional LysR family regulator
VHPELKHMRYFVAVAEELNFSAAARRLYVSQQALSRVIQQFERELGVQLFERTTRSVRLTRAGDALLESAKRSISAAEEAFETARRAESGAGGRVLRVDISSSGLETGASVLRRLRRDHPDICVHQVEQGVPRGLVALREGRLDALFGLATYCPPEIQAEVIRREPVLVGMAADHPLANLDAVPVARLADYDLLLPSDEDAAEWVEFVRLFCGQAGVRPRRWPGSTHGAAAHAEVLREAGCVVPTPAWTEPPSDLVFRPLVAPAPVLTWSIMTVDQEGRADVDTLRRCARAVGAECGWPSGLGHPHHRRVVPVPGDPLERDRLRDGH